jgi:hypothetical protein
MKYKNFNDLNENIIYDVVIIGAGPAGITTYKHLISSGYKIILLEGGQQETTIKSDDIYKGDWDFSFSPINRPSDMVLNSSRVRALGGSSNHWAGHMAPLNEVDFMELRSTGGSIIHRKWPIDYSKIKPFYEKAKDFLNINSNIDLGRKKLNFKGMEDFEIQPFIKKYINFRSYLNAESDSIYLDCNLVTFEYSKNKTSLKSIVISQINNKNKFKRVESKVFILAAGGIENARILKNNKISSSNSGYGFMGHLHLYDRFLPRMKLMQNFSEIFNNTKNIDEGYELLNFLAISRSAQVKYKLPSTFFAVKEWAVLLKIGEQPINDLTFNFLTGNIKPLVNIESTIMMECIQDSWSTVNVSEKEDFFGKPRALVRKDFNRIECESILSAQELLATSLLRAKIGMYFPTLNLKKLFLGMGLGLAWHHIGTTVMGDDKTISICDKNCKVHDLDNLYIGGSSVFPSSGSVNPTFTIVALSIRLADFIKGKLQSTI